MDSFVWDATKAESNVRKHGVRFDRACDVFNDAFAFEFIDDREDYGEDRYVIIGMAFSKLMYVVYTPRFEKIRLISARFAEPLERNLYHEFNSKK